MILRTADEIMGSLERGDVAKDFAAAFQRVLEGCQELDEAKGSVKLTFSIDVKGELATITAKIDEVVPKKKRRASNFWITQEGQLSMSNPQQIDMTFTRKRSAVDQD